MQRINRRVHRTRAGEGSVIAALGLARAAVLHDAREIVPLAQQDEGEALVVAQKHVVRRAEALDELRFQQQRLCLRIGGDDLHRPALADHALQSVRQRLHLGVVRHPRLQAARLAHVEHVSACIQHAIDAGLGLQRLHHLPNGGNARFQIGLRAALHGRGGAFLVETLLASWVGRGSGFGSRHAVRDRRRGHVSQSLAPCKHSGHPPLPCTN